MNRTRISLVIVGMAALGILFFNACKKDRVPLDDYQSMDSFYNDNMEPEQEFVIDTPGTCPLTCMKGTCICVSADMFSFADNTPITYPFTLKVVELYSIKEMLLYRMPSVSGSNILETSAEIRVRAFKGSSELILKPGRAYLLETANMPTVYNNMQVYFGGVGDWTLSTNALTTVMDTASFYRLTVGQMGFVSAARVHSSSASNTTLTLTVPGTNTQNIQSYVSFSNFKGLMRITNLVSGSIPVGEQVTLVAFAKKQTNDYVLHQRSFAVSANQQEALDMQVVSQSGLLTALAAL